MKRAECRAKSSASHKGVPLNHRVGCKCGVCRAKRGEFRGENNPTKRPEVAKKIGDTQRGKSCPKRSLSKLGKKNPMCGRTGKQSPRYGISRPEHSAFMREKNPMNSIIARDKVSRAISALWDKGEIQGMRGKTGELASNWQGGIGNLPYGFEFNKDLKLAIRERDGFVCQLCGKSETGRAFSTHHIDYNKLNNSQDNLILLCNSCNARVNYSRSEWQFLFECIQEIRLVQV